MQKKRGFTIVELLVVVGIIAVLSAIVLVNVTKYINRAKDAAIMGNMATIMTNGAIFYDDKGTYENFCSDAYVTVPRAAIESAGGTNFTCQVEPTYFDAWCACARLKSSIDTFCVDSTGYKKRTSTNCGIRCPATNVKCGD